MGSCLSHHIDSEIKLQQQLVRHIQHTSSDRYIQSTKLSQSYNPSSPTRTSVHPINSSSNDSSADEDTYTHAHVHVQKTLNSSKQHNKYKYKVYQPAATYETPISPSIAPPA